MKNVVAGTAGHIDHGKTALVRALTGIDTDRLEEEKRRGISIDLGFAHLDLGPELRVALVDVPGHERFIRNMLAGAAGIDAVLLVVAADESIKPQTREHFDICRLLGVPRGVVALTKADLVDSDILELVRLEVEEFLAGSFLEGAPVIPVSAVTGQGLAELRAALKAVLAEVPAKDTSAHFRLPVDRAFAMKGFGTVVTGTIVGGVVAVEQEVEAHPDGRTLRVRGIQVHGEAVKRASAGQRAALNVAGAEAGELPRGTVLAERGKCAPTRRFDAMLELLSSAKPLKNRAPVHLHAGTAEAVAEIRTLDRTPVIQPGSTAAVRVVLREPMLLTPGDRFVVRMFSPVVTIAGGEVVDAHPPARVAPERTPRLAKGSLAERVATLVRESAYGLGLEAVEVRTGATAQALAEAVPPSVLRIEAPQPWFFDREWLSARYEDWRQQLAAYHKANPLSPGMSREQLRSRALPKAPAFVFDAVLAQGRQIVATGDVLHLATHRIALKREEEEARAKIEAAFRDAGLSVPAVKEVIAACGIDASRARSLLQMLLRERRLVKVSEDLVFHPSAMEALRTLLAARRGQRFGVPEFKEWTGVSRKYAIPLLEYLDRERVTRREGDDRVVL